MNKLMISVISVVFIFVFVGEVLVIEWNVLLWGICCVFIEYVEKLVELVSEKIGGEFILNLSYGGLLNNCENFDGILIGVFEMVQFCVGYYVDKNLLIIVLELLFFGVMSFEQEIELLMVVYSYLVIVVDLGCWNVILFMLLLFLQYNVVGIGDVLLMLVDFEGLLVCVIGGIGVVMEIIGVVFILMLVFEVCQVMDSGVVKVVSFVLYVYMLFGIIENGEWWIINLNLGIVNCFVVVNIDVLDSLFDEYCDVLLSLVDEVLEYYVFYYNEQIMVVWGFVFEEKGIVLVIFFDEELVVFKEVVVVFVVVVWIEVNIVCGLFV